MTDNINEEIIPDYNYTYKVDINDIFRSFCYGPNGAGYISNTISVNCDSKKISNNEINVIQPKNYYITNQADTSGTGEKEVGE